MRRFYIVWGAFTYSLLITISGGGLYALTQIGDERDNTSFLIFMAVSLFIVAASLLTRMLLGIFSELRSLESEDKMNSTAMLPKS
jgi:hypothetical protein